MEGQVKSSEVQQSEREQLLGAKNSALLIELDNVKSSMDACHGKLESLQNENGKLLDESEILKSVKDEMDNRYKSLTAERDSLATTIDKMKSDLTVQLATFNTELNETKQNYKTLMDESEVTKQDLTHHREKLEQSQNELKELTESNINLKSVNQLADENTQELNEVVLNLHNEMSSLQTERTGLLQRVDNHEEELLTIRKEKEAMVDKLLDVQSQLKSTQELKTKTESELETVKVDLDHLKQEHENLKVEKEEQSKLAIQDAQTSEVFSELQPIIKELTDDLDMPNAPVSPKPSHDSVSASDQKALEGELKEREELIKSQNDQVAHLESIKDQLEADLEQLKNQFNDLIAEKEKLVEDLNQSRADCEQLANELVSQYNRFTQEKIDYETELKSAYDEKFEIVIQEKEVEADELEKDFNLQIAEKVGEFNVKILGTDFYIF